MFNRKGRWSIKIMCVLVMSLLFITNGGSIPTERCDQIDADGRQESLALQEEIQPLDQHGNWKINTIYYSNGIKLIDVEYLPSSGPWKMVAGYMSIPYIEMNDYSIGLPQKYILTNPYYYGNNYASGCWSIWAYYSLSSSYGEELVQINYLFYDHGEFRIVITFHWGSGWVKYRFPFCAFFQLVNPTDYVEELSPSKLPRLITEEQIFGGVDRGNYLGDTGKIKWSNAGGGTEYIIINPGDLETNVKYAINKQPIWLGDDPMTPINGESTVARYLAYWHILDTGWDPNTCCMNTRYTLRNF